jgi:hypothetical protein
VKKPILGQPKQQDSIASIDLQDLPDLMSFDEENLELIAMERPSSPSSVSRISSTVSDAASAIESEIKGLLTQIECVLLVQLIIFLVHCRGS